MKLACVHTPLMMRIASSRPSTFSRGVRTPSPNPRNSSSDAPAPSPRISLPPERRSKVSAILASTAGFRYGRPSTRVATPIRVVEAAIQASIVHVS